MNALDKIIQEMMSQDTIFRGNTIENNFPKYRITKMSTYKFKLEIALAGYNKDCIKVTSMKNKLSVKYEHPLVETKEKLAQDYPIVIENTIAERDFEKVWTTNEQYIIDVLDVTMKDGILSIDIEIIVPDDWKEKTYKVK